MITKEQELRALEEIKKIVERLGEDSYIAMAFDGCFEIAEDNIGNDFGCSMKQRLEIAEKKLSACMQENEELKARCEKAEKKVINIDDLREIKKILYTNSTIAIAKVQKTSEDIVEFADNPDGDDFKSAVRLNRNARLKADKYQRLFDKLSEIVQ